MWQHSIIGLQGTELRAEERAWLRRKPPLGVILFARNIASPAQVCALLDEARQCAGTDLWGVIDEEGGRVHRLPWPPFSDRVAARIHGRRFHRDPEQARQRVFADALRVGQALKELGFSHNCAPVLDVFSPDGHAIIGERAYDADPDIVAALGEAAMRGYIEAGIAPVGKHFPGHGRADADSHLALPHVRADVTTILQEATPFARLIQAGLHHVMTAHVVYDQADAHVATCSSFWLQTVLRDRLGFSGHIWSDDLCMRGVGEDPVHAAGLARQAGCDVLLICQPDGVRRAWQAWCA